MSNYVNLLDIVYPINSVYISFSSTSPSSTIGGTWDQLTNRVIRAANDTNTGGLDTQTKNFDHNHYMSLSWSGSANFNVSNNATGFNIHVGDAKPPTSSILTSNSSLVSGAAAGANGRLDYPAKPLSNVSWNNLPAYQNCYIWHRTA